MDVVSSKETTCFDFVDQALHTERDMRMAHIVDKLPSRRTGEEIGESGGSFYGEQHKSRYAGVSLYIDNSARFKDKYNDVP